MPSLKPSAEGLTEQSPEWYRNAYEQMRQENEQLRQENESLKSYAGTAADTDDAPMLRAAERKLSKTQDELRRANGIIQDLEERAEQAEAELRAANTSLDALTGAADSAQRPKRRQPQRKSGSRKARSQGRRSAPPSQRPAEEELADNYDDSDEDFESQSDDDGAHDFGSRKPQQRRQPRNSPSATPVEETLKLARRALNNTEYERVKEFTAHRRRIASQRSQIDTSPPKQFPHLYHNPRRDRMEKEWKAQQRRNLENMEKRIQDISKRQPISHW